MVDTWLSIVIAGALRVPTALPGAAPVASVAVVAPDDAICAAITRTVAARLGAGAVVRACVVEAAPPSDAGVWLEADPDAAARVGESSWFTLVASAASARVKARVDVDMPHARAAETLIRGRMLASTDLVAATGSIAGARFQRVVAPGALPAARTTRPIEAGAVLQAADVVMPPTIRAGDAIVAVVRIGAVEVSAAMTAVDAGAVGDEIRISSREQKRVLRGRVVGPGRVEVLNEQ